MPKRLRSTNPSLATCLNLADPLYILFVSSFIAFTSPHAHRWNLYVEPTQTFVFCTALFSTISPTS